MSLQQKSSVRTPKVVTITPSFSDLRGISISRSAMDSASVSISTFDSFLIIWFLIVSNQYVPSPCRKLRFGWPQIGRSVLHTRRFIWSSYLAVADTWKIVLASKLDPSYLPGTLCWQLLGQPHGIVSFMLWKHQLIPCNMSLEIKDGVGLQRRGKRPQCILRENQNNFDKNPRWTGTVWPSFFSKHIFTSFCVCYLV